MENNINSAVAETEALTVVEDNIYAIEPVNSTPVKDGLSTAGKAALITGGVIVGAGAVVSGVAVYKHVKRKKKIQQQVNTINGAMDFLRENGYEIYEKIPDEEAKS